MLLAVGWLAFVWLRKRSHLLLRRLLLRARNHGALDLLWATEGPALPDASAQRWRRLCGFGGRMQLWPARHLPIDAYIHPMRGRRVGLERQRHLRPLIESSGARRRPPPDDTSRCPLSRARGDDRRALALDTLNRSRRINGTARSRVVTRSSFETPAKITRGAARGTGQCGTQRDLIAQEGRRTRRVLPASLRNGHVSTIRVHGTIQMLAIDALDGRPGIIGQIHTTRV